MELFYFVENESSRLNLELAWGCFAGCCTFINRGLDY